MFIALGWRSISSGVALASIVFLGAASVEADEGAHPHPMVRVSVGEAGPVRVRATLSRGSHELRMLDRLFLRLDVTADADVMEPPAPMSAIRPAVGGAGPDGASPADPSVPGPTLLGPVPSATPSRRPPLSLALVIDHSGSMAEDRKWEFAVEAAHLVIENLSARDIVTVVGFGDVATVLSPAGLAVNSAFLRHRLTDIEPKGWTNLSAGLLEAFAQLDRAVPGAAPEGRVKRVIVLTDGAANRGVTDPARLRDMVSVAKGRGIGVSTMGCGTTYSESVLRALAEAGGGRYVYVSNPEQIPGAMAAELEGFLAVAAQNARLRVSVPAADGTGGSGAGRILRVLGRPSGTPAHETSLELGDMRSGESGTFLLEVAPPAAGSLRVQVELTFDRPDTAARERFVVRVGSTPRAGAANDADDPSVTLYAEMIDALSQAAIAAKGLDELDSTRAEQDLATLYPKVRSVALERRDQEMLNAAFLLAHLVDEIRAARAAGLVHGHENERAHFEKDADYLRYLLEHHRSPHR